jgi:hypothetical protein
MYSFDLGTSGYFGIFPFVDLSANVDTNTLLCNANLKYKPLSHASCVFSSHLFL